jgi:cytochrome c
VALACAPLGISLAASSGDAGRGKALYDKHCAVCHSLILDYHKEGPSLHRIYGRKAGSVPFYAGYKVLRGSDLVWDDATLDRWLADPKAFGRGDTKMTLVIDDAQHRADIIAYLRAAR